MSGPEVKVTGAVAVMWFTRTELERSAAQQSGSWPPPHGTDSWKKLVLIYSPPTQQRSKDGHNCAFPRHTL